MLVVADSSPLNYLILIGHVESLPALFGSVVIPTEVSRELSHSSAPDSVRSFISQSPDWLIVQSPKAVVPIDELDARESAAISLVLELKADLLLVDDLDGRRAAEQRGISIAGTLGILKLAADRGLIELTSAIEKLEGCGFHVSKNLIQDFLRKDS